MSDSLKVKDVESIWIDIKIDSCENRKLRIGNFYRAGNFPRAAQIKVDHLICDEIRRNFIKNCLILGDFNLKEYEEKTGELNHECRMYKKLFEEEIFMHQFVNELIRLHSILDLVFSDNHEIVRELTVNEGLGRSDHNMIKFHLTWQNRPKDSLQMIPNLNKADFASIRNELALIDWEYELGGLDACEAWDKFKLILNNIQSRHIPLKHKRKKKKHSPPWLTAEVRKAIRVKSFAFRALKESMLESNKVHYQRCRDDVKKKVRAAKRAKELDLAKNCKGDSKKFFSFYKLTSTGRNIGPLKNNDAIISDDKDMVELLSDQFSSVFTIEDKNETALLQMKCIAKETMSQINDINSELVRKHLSRVKPNKAEGPDEIHARILRECQCEISAPLASIFSKSLADAKIPLDWKRANVVPIFKKGDKSKVENYRPVSLTSLACKVLESIIKDKLINFLEENNLIGNTQHGFRKGRSCLTNLLHFLDFATESFDKRKQLDVSYLDFSKAFDKVPHKRLVLQLKRHGIDGKTLNWIENWLSGRQQRVLLNGNKSQWKDVLSGVPQGSVLGPLLFLVFVNTIDDDVDSKVLKFADDIKIFKVIEGKQDQDIFQADLDKLVEWAETWQMKFNIDKCKVMHIGRVKTNTMYTMGGQQLKQIEKEKDLGVIINNKISSSDQVLEARKKALRMLGAIYRNVTYKSADVITKLYCAFVRPHLEYCVQAWSPTYEKDCWLLERVQKRATKMVKGLQNLQYEDRLKSLNMFSLKYRRLRGDLIEVFKFVTGVHAGYLEDMFEFDREHRGRCHRHKLVVKQSRTRLRHSFFSRKVVSYWNSLPHDVVDATSLMLFKARLDKHFTSKGLVYKY